jgi:hypothetical protein
MLVRAVATIIVVSLVLMGIVVWENCSQDIHVSLRSSGDAYVVDISARDDEVCVNSLQPFVLYYGLWPVHPKGVMATTVVECPIVTTMKRVSVPIYLNDKFDRETVARGWVCLRLFYRHLNSSNVWHTKISCE